MPNNFLITGPPRSGKTTVIQRVRSRLKEQGYRVDGIYCPELRVDGTRVGFEIMDLTTGDARVLAHVDQADGPSVGKYRVNVENIDTICASAIPRAFEEADVLLVDEIAPMEVHSDEFGRQVTRALDAEMLLIAAIHYRSTEGFIGEVKARDDIELFEVSEGTRDELPATLTAVILERV